ncbi:uncharacterized protein EI90DRAFT_245693 [Cantharellus anzutake]|uniref:uncharacterized protein n=1 Tax=Cantharellus anzutake TaxID=1750568 RepID=UPI00190672D5|nr:uncharacterized protein EI90DRAFT_245693 [Cantharellus anzutake]KAF8335701.1 hypothetical protein EI90DRAFT_245693 [Cantharellus anzutake]
MYIQFHPSLLSRIRLRRQRVPLPFNSSETSATMLPAPVSTPNLSLPSLHAPNNMLHIHFTFPVLEHFTRLTSVLGTNTHRLNASLSRLHSSLKLDSPLHNSSPYALYPYHLIFPHDLVVPLESTLGNSAAEDAFLKARAAAEETILLIGLVGQDLQK